MDFITINKRFRNAIRQVKTYPGADCNSNHVKVVVTLLVQLRKLTRNEVKPKRELATKNKRLEEPVSHKSEK